MVRKGRLMQKGQTTTSQIYEAFNVVDGNIEFTIYESDAEKPPEYADDPELRRRGSVGFAVEEGHNIKVEFNFGN